ncbi:MAG: DNA starvation/stationary phase protection protein Dps [Chloroflexota bacterium]
MNPTTRTYPTANSLDVTVRAEMIGILNQLLADSLDLYSQCKQAHWNVKGMNFIALHQLFDQIAEAVEPIIDELGERVTALGADAQGTVRMAAENSRLPEFPSDLDTGEQFVEITRDRVSLFGNNTREAVNTAMEAGDEATADLFIGIVREMDKLTYFLEAHLR